MSTVTVERAQLARALDADPAAERPRAARLLGLVVGLATAVAYSPGLGRSIDFDGAETVGYFVVTPSFTDSLFTQREFNNPPFFSFLQHLVYSATGRHDVSTMRVLPIVFAAAAVGVVAWGVARRWGWPAGAVAAAVLASNPMFAQQSRAVRGYSLLILCAAGATLALLAMRGSVVPSRRQRLTYGACAAAGLATHLFMAPILLAHLALVLDDHRRSDRAEPLGDRLRPLVWGIAVGSIPWLVILPAMLSHGGNEGHAVQPRFPLDVAHAVLGGTALAVALLLAALVVGLAPIAGRREVRLAAAVVAVVGLGTWLVIAPMGLAARWFTWLVPVVAVLVARGVRTRPLLALPVAVAVVASCWAWVPTMTHSDNSTPLAARAVGLAAEAGLRPCVENVSVAAVLSITDAFHPVVSEDDFAACDVIVSVFPGLDRELTPIIERTYPHSGDLHDEGNGVIWSRTPIPDEWLEGRPAPPR